MADDVDLERLPAELKERADRERAAGNYPDDLSAYDLEPPGDGFDLRGDAPRIRFRPELGFSSKPVIGPGITLVKRFYLRLLLHVFDDLARQTDTAIGRVESALALEIAARERLDERITELEQEVRALRGEAERA